MQFARSKIVGSWISCRGIDQIMVVRCWKVFGEVGKELIISKHKCNQSLLLCTQVLQRTQARIFEHNVWLQRLTKWNSPWCHLHYRQAASLPIINYNQLNFFQLIWFALCCYFLASKQTIRYNRSHTKFEGTNSSNKVAKRVSEDWLNTTFDICKCKCEIPKNPQIFNGKVTCCFHENTEFHKRK